MASWLGGIGTGLGQSLGQVGGSLSSFTGQISSFTKDILLEGTEEVGDAATELQHKELEAAYITQKSEYERLKKIHMELEEKHEAAEIQIKQQSSEYRGQLQQKEVEISHLKARQNTLQDQLHKLQTVAQSAQGDAAILPATSTSTSFLSRDRLHPSFQNDDMDFGDVIWSQQEINRLSNEVSKLQAEVAHWRTLSQTFKTQGAVSTDQGEIYKLQKTIKELKETMSQEIDEHQHELSALQDAHRHKLSEMTCRHREELAEYEERIEELEEQLQPGGSSAGTPEHFKASEQQQTIRAMEIELTSRKQSAEELEHKIKEMTESLIVAEQERVALLQEKEDAQSETDTLMQTYKRLQNTVDELQTRVDDQTEKSMQKSHLENEINGLKKALVAAEKEITRLKNLNQSKAEVEHADILELNTIITTLKEEKEQIEKEKTILKEQLENIKPQQTVEDNAGINEELGAELLEVKELSEKLQEKERLLADCTMERDTLMAEVEELDKQNQEATRHLISIKDQLVQQRKAADITIDRLQSELESTRKDLVKRESQHKTMQKEVESQREKLSQSAFTLNDMHMSKQQIQETMKDLKQQLGKAQERSTDFKKENSELKEQLQKAEEELSAAKLELSKSGDSTSDSGQQEQLLEQKEREISKLRREILESKNLHEKVLATNYELKMEVKKLQVDYKNAEGSLEVVNQQLRDAQSVKDKVTMEKDTRLEALRMEKVQLETELNHTEKRLMEQAKQYRQTIEELTRARNMDASALQTEHERLVKLNQQKDLEISELKQSIEQMEADHQETKEMLTSSLSGQKQLTELIKEKDVFMEKFKERVTESQKELEKCAKATKECEVLKHALEEKDKQLAVMKEENSHLKEEIDRLKDQQSRPQSIAEPKTLDIITELETEIAQLKTKKDGLEDEITALKKTMKEQKGSFHDSLQEQERELDQAKTMTFTYEKLILEKDKEIVSLQESIDQIKMQFQREMQVIHTDSVILQEDKSESLNRENGNEKHDLSKVEIDRLVNGMKEKEIEINLLNEKNLSLTKQLDQLVGSKDEVGKLTLIIQQKDLEIQALHARVTSGTYTQDVIYLQQQIQAYAVEREQVLAVLNEKTRENSQLKSEYHRLMDIVAAKETALLKLQEENQKMSSMNDIGSQDMVRETIQNLSRIIREKDIEIDALTQKCQTLLTVLQTSNSGPGSESSGVSSNQFEELLQERDNLKQQVKKMEEWKQQVITTVKNMQHESAQLQEELIKLQSQVSSENDCNSKLSVHYNSLIQGYEQKEKKLGSLSQELAQVQQSISQLSSTKDFLLEKLGLDLVVNIPEVITPLMTATPSEGTILEENEGQVKRLHLELEHLRKVIEEKDTTIRTLKENNHRLSNSLASTSESEKKGQEAAASEIKQTKDRLDVLQKSLREKDLLIKSKGDQLNPLTESLRNKENDNEVLKQAVTNLKERTLILEMDIHKLKEENDQIMVRSREKETEFRALQETNMQFSMLLREKEFESNSMREKASALEKMLKEREQGKSGELNQLLNEVKSMHEKAVKFQKERDQMMLALKQKQMETSAIQNEMQHLRDKEQRLAQELDRLRNHLIEMEDSYTREAVAAGDRETELRRKVTALQEKLDSSSTAVESASHQASMQVESLQEQLNTVVRQRDETLIQLNMSQEQVKQYAVSLSNLQMVLEQFQQEEKAMYSAELEKHKKEKAEWKRKAEKLGDRVSSLQTNLDEANTALESASRLTDQLDLKEEQIEELNRQVGLRQEMLEDAQNKLMNLVNSTEGKVDKVLMRNLFVGHFHTPKNKQQEVLRLMGSVLGLQKEEMDELMEEGRGVTGWVSSWLGGRSAQSVPNTPLRPGHASILNNSFSELFVKFLEVESRPPPKLPVYDMKPLSAPPPGKHSSSTAANATGLPGANKRIDFNPFLAPRSAAVPLMTTAAPGAGGTGHLLMKPISDALPTFTPLPVSSDASAGAVLKDLLKQ
ncbi:thyroid receptor-interacting protein 11-like [Acipenser ruthenus]|uniref:thyroid receptor-interacting protein 11-like n=1 Tax=Acipenser ruthenus TaxID=7906 RepID=UPI0027413775|nr:thyroid receptor-interacting protein 11-like [Acipenser ruthenus]